MNHFINATGTFLPTQLTYAIAVSLLHYRETDLNVSLIDKRAISTVSVSAVKWSHAKFRQILMLFLCAVNGTGSSDSHWKAKFNGCIYNSNVLLISNINTMIQSLKCSLQGCKSRRSHTDAVQTFTWLARSCHYKQGVQHSCAKVTDLSSRTEVRKIPTVALQCVATSFLKTAGFAFLNVNLIMYILSSHCLWLLCQKTHNYVLFCSFCFIRRKRVLRSLTFAFWPHLYPFHLLSEDAVRKLWLQFLLVGE